MEPSTSDPATSSDPAPPTVVTQRSRAGANRLIPDPDKLGELASTNQSSAEKQQQQHSASTSSTTGSFACNICLDTAHDAVVSMCGHLYCWPCLHQWMETPCAHLVCPVCKAAISMDKVVPLYGHGSDYTHDPRMKVPPRPAGRRVEPEPNGAAGNGNPGPGGFLGSLFGNTDLGGGHNFRMSVGIGAFPLGFLATTFNVGGVGNADGGAHASRPNDQQVMATVSDNDFMSKLCLCVAFFCVVWLIVA